MKSSQQIIVFDFDGVISNSIHDSFMTALNTYIQSVPDHKLPLEQPLTPNMVFQFEKEHPDIFHRFSTLIPMSNFADDYFVIFSLIEKNEMEKIKNQASFDKYKGSIPKGKLSSYKKLFYHNRRSMQERDPVSWASLLQLFPGILEAVQFLSSRFITAIGTSKDRASVDILLGSYGLSDYFRPENILDRDFANNKREHLIRFQKEHEIPFQNIHFIDDKVLHLLSVKDLGNRNYLALWGFNSEREYEIARKEGFTLLELEDLKNLGESMS